MPYDPKHPPEKMRGLSPKKQRQWVHVLNQALGDGDDEGTAHAKAWGVVKKSSLDEIIGPTENEGSLYDAIRNQDILAAREMASIAHEIGHFNRKLAALLIHEASELESHAG